MTGNLMTLVMANLEMSQVIHDYVMPATQCSTPACTIVCIKFCKMTLEVIGTDNHIIHGYTHAHTHIHIHMHMHMLYAGIHTCITRTKTPF